MIEVSVGADYNSAHVQRCEFAGFEELAAFVLEQQAHGGKVGPYICAPMRENRRNSANAELVQHVTLDFDAGLGADTPAAIWRAIEAAGWRASMWTTRSSTPVAPRLRILLPLDRALTKPEYGACYRGAVRFLADRTGVPLKGDPRCEKPEQPAILPQPASTVWSNTDGAQLISDAFIAYDPAPTNGGDRPKRKNAKKSNGARHPRMGDVLEKVLAGFENVQQVTADRWTACCPCHDSKSQASLNISDAGDRVLMFDFGGCSTTDVLAAVGLTARDLFAGSTHEPDLPPLDAYADDDPTVIHAKPQPDKPQSAALIGIDFADMRPQLTASYIVKGLLDTGIIGTINGVPGCGKSFFVVDLACHVASGRQWRGHRVRGGLVVHCALEGGARVQNRFAAWRERHLGSALGALPLRLTPGPVNLRDPLSIALLIEFVKQAEADHGEKCVLVTIDTLSRALAGGEENGSEDMGALLQGADMIRNATGASVVLVHHVGKDKSKGGRGHSLLLGGIDMEILIDVDGDTRIAKVTKQRDLPDGAQYAFTLESVDLGVDDEGDMVRTCLVGIIDDVPSRRERPKSGSHQDKLLAAILEWQRSNNLGSVSDRELREIAKVQAIDRRRYREVCEWLIKYGWLEASMGGFRIVPEGSA